MFKTMAIIFLVYNTLLAISSVGDMPEPTTGPWEWDIVATVFIYVTISQLTGFLAGYETAVKNREKYDGNAEKSTTNTDNSHVFDNNISNSH